MDPVEVRESELHELSVGGGHDTKLSLQQVLAIVPSVKVHVVVLVSRTNNVSHSDDGSNVNIHILLIVVLGKNESAFTFGQEANIADLITLEEDVLMVVEYNGLQQWTEPCDKRVRLVLEVIDLLVKTFVQEY